MELFEEIYEKYYNQLKRFAISLARGIDEAEELTQETFLRALENIELLKILPEYKRRSWLFSVLKNYFIDVKRKLKFEKNFDENFDAECPEIDYDIKIDVQEMISKLPEKLRGIVFKKYWLDMTSMEISRQLFISDSTVRNHLQTAINLLRQKVK